MLVFKKLLLPGCVLLLNFAFALSMPADTKAAARDKSSMDAFFGVTRPEAIGGKLWLVIVLGIIPIILLACIIAVIAFVVCRKKKSKDDQDEDGDEDGDEEEDDEEEEAKDKEEEMLQENPTQEPSSDYEKVDPSMMSLI